MTDQTSPPSPLEAVAGTAGRRATHAFSLLGNETRLSILLALWEAYEPFAAQNAVPFTELRDRVGTRDSGQFNYHLGKLEGHFLEKTDHGYALRNAGLRLIQTVIAGAGVAEPPRDPTPIPHDCSRCGAQTAVVYRDERLYLVCTACEGYWGGSEEWPDGMLAAGSFDPAGFSERSPIEAWNANWITLTQSIQSGIGGVCDVCSGPMDGSLHVCEDHATEGVCENCGGAVAIMGRFRCEVCKNHHRASPGVIVAQHPAVIGFYADRGIPLVYEVGEYELGQQAGTLIGEHEHELAAREPPQVRVTIAHEGESMTVTLDEDLTVVEITPAG